MQYGVALFYFTLKMCFQYREPNPWSRRLAAYALEKLAGYLCTWLKGGAVQPSAATASLMGPNPDPDPIPNPSPILNPNPDPSPNPSPNPHLTR